MDEKSKEDLGKEIHDRLIHSIKKDRRRKIKRNLSTVSFILVFAIVGCLVFFKQDHILDFFKRTEGKEVTADFLAGTLTEQNNSFSKTEPLSVGNDESKAIFLDKDKKMVLNISRLGLGEDDILNIKTGIGEVYKVELPDGSIVNLNANSDLHYAASYPKDRKLTLAGEAYFEVKSFKKDNKKVPFEVKTEQQTIQVLGTSFNVKTTGSYDETFLYKGSLNVKAVHTGENNKLKPGNLIRVNSNQALMKSLDEGEIEEYLAWKDGFLYYDNRSLGFILEDLQKYYDFKFDRNSVPAENFTIYLARENKLEELILLLDASSHSILQLNDKVLTFRK